MILRSRWKKLGAFLPLILLVPMGIMDWDHFFPLSAQTDLVFQVTGELLELIALVGLCQVLSFGIAKLRGDGLSAGNRAIFQLFLAISFGLFLVTLSWRDFFSNHRFIFSAGSHHLPWAFLGGLIFALLGFLLQKAQSSPSKGDEKATV